MRFYNRANPQSGLSLVEVIITSALLLLIVGGMMAFFQSAVQLVGSAKARAGAVSLANQKLEYIRSLPYNDAGTINGIPSGQIPQTASTTLNGIEYQERVLIEFVDSPDDGVGADDQNGILADYKRAKVEYSWDQLGETKSIALITNLVPIGIESIEGGGTVTVNVFDANALPVAGASVQLFNNTATTVDVTRFTNDDGIAQFAGAPAAAGYELVVTGDNMSTDQTYVASSTNPNPATPPVAVVESQVSTMNFQIDTLSNLSITTVGLPTTASFDDTFNDSLSIFTSNQVTVGGGEVVLAGSPVYVGSGNLRSASTTPTSFSSWDTASFTLEELSDTDIFVQVYSVSGTNYTLVPDVDLPGNSSGFATGTVSLLGLNPITYPSLALGAELSTNDASITPKLLDWRIDYTVSELPIADVPFTLTGDKVIGTLADESPVYKYQRSHSTDSGGSLALSGLEWDSYDLSLDTSAYVIYEACEPLPYRLDPGVKADLKLTLLPTPTRSLHVYVLDINLEPVPGATVTLSNASVNDLDTTSACGQTIFASGLPSATDYVVDVSAAGYTDTTQENITIDGNNTLVVTLNTL